jgi:uncharacterized protein YqjF (DUF2071 family)
LVAVEFLRADPRTVGDCPCSETIEFESSRIAMSATQSALPAAASPVERRVFGYQRWSDLLFVHWRLSPERIASLLPAGLELDSWDGDAWLGLVPLHMSGVRPWWFPATPGLSEFHETNLRTYVTLDGRPGVWFFSLDAANRFAVRVARRRWHLNYFYARMALERAGERITYRSRRVAGEFPAGMEATVYLPVGEPARRAAPGSLEHFLMERYVLFSRAPDGRLFSGRVSHPPYEFAPVRIERLQETLTAAAGIVVDGAPCHAVHSGGVSVAILPLTPQLRL